MISGEGKAFELVRTPDGDRAAWLEERRHGVGGSDVAAIMGLSRHRAPYEVWAEKSGLADPDDISDRPPVMWGNILEPVVGSHYAQLHPDREVRRVNAVCRSLSRPWAQASLDYEVKDPELGWGVLEIKTAGLRSADDWADGVPVYYQTQIAHYLTVTGRPFADVAVLIGGQDYREHRYMAADLDLDVVSRAVDEFWHGNVEAGVAPAIEGRAGEADALLKEHPRAGELRIESHLSTELADFLSAKKSKDAADRRYTRAANILKERIGDDAGIECPGEGRVRWVRSMRSRVNLKRLAADHPEIAEEYTESKLTDGGLRWFPERRP